MLLRFLSIRHPQWDIHSAVKCLRVLAHGLQLLFFALEFLDLILSLLDELLLAFELFSRGNVLDQELVLIVALLENSGVDIGIGDVYTDLTRNHDVELVALVLYFTINSQIKVVRQI